MAASGPRLTRSTDTEPLEKPWAPQAGVQGPCQSLACWGRLTPALCRGVSPDAMASGGRVGALPHRVTEQAAGAVSGAAGSQRNLPRHPEGSPAQPALRAEPEPRARLCPGQRQPPGDLRWPGSSRSQRSGGENRGTLEGKAEEGPRPSFLLGAVPGGPGLREGFLGMQTPDFSGSQNRRGLGPAEPTGKLELPPRPFHHLLPTPTWPGTSPAPRCPAVVVSGARSSLPSPCARHHLGQQPPGEQAPGHRHTAAPELLWAQGSDRSDCVSCPVGAGTG